MKEIELSYPNSIAFMADVYFSKLHILKSIKLNILFDKKSFVIYGYDYYNTRQTKFLFSSDLEQLTNVPSLLPTYQVSDFELLKVDTLILKGNGNEKITADLNRNINLKQIIIDNELLNLLNNLTSNPNNKIQ
ncbi:hypothetical protein [Ulvibacter antarcticus]|uniref:hypothetical protein n=1 Tax=Ulvibacter antarcticus TaxID=442714 RepID=UPI0011C4322C|nr:hypothetical protein [Ulvibacter antarcticus]